MNNAATIRRSLTGAVLSLVIFAAPLRAEDISPSHLEAAKAAIAAIHVTDSFDGILPQAAQDLKGQLIERNPNLSELITKTVDDQTLALASRRGDLEKEVAMVYARVFNEDELKKIAAFYQTPAGKKLISDGPIASRETLKAAKIWQAGISRDLGQSVSEVLAKAAPDTYGNAGTGQSQNSGDQSQKQ